MKKIITLLMVITMIFSLVNYVSELLGKPVEVTLEDGVFKDFRILTEVL